MSILVHRVAFVLLVAAALPAVTFADAAKSSPASAPVEKPPEANAPAAKTPTARERLNKQAAESYQRLKELREALVHLEQALAGNDADKAWEHSAQLTILWDTLPSKQRISFERRYPGTRVRVEKALTEGKVLARSAAPKAPIAAKSAEKADPEVALARKAAEQLPEPEAGKKPE